jgi:hypothetical protein
MIAEANSESVSEKRRRGRPRTSPRELADEILPGPGCDRTRANQGYRLWALYSVHDLLTDAEQRDVFGAALHDVRLGRAAMPRGWDSAAVEIGRLLVWSRAEGADDDTARGYLQVAVNARRDGVSWRAIRSHFRILRLGERQGNAVALSIELSRTIDAYLARFPATTKQMLVGAVESLLEVVSEQNDAESGSPAENDLTICD